MRAAGLQKCVPGPGLLLLEHNIGMLVPKSTVSRPLIPSIGGAILCILLACIAIAAERAIGGGVSALIVGLVLGMAVATWTKLPESWPRSFDFFGKTLLRWTVCLLGTQVSFTQLSQLGKVGLAVTLAPLAIAILTTITIGWLVRSEWREVALLAIGSGVCGASAILAANTIVNGRNDQVAVALTIVTIYGSIGLFAAPALGAVLGLSNEQYGLWVGASLHEVAQVVGAAFQFNDESGSWAIVAKLARVACLAPLLLCLSSVVRFIKSDAPETRRARIFVPWYVAGFVIVVLANSAFGIPDDLKHLIGQLLPFLLALTLVAIGLQTRVQDILSAGWRPIFLGGAATIVISASSLALILALVK